jgi:Cdc6-like AAA superfamily ATPase
MPVVKFDTILSTDLPPKNYLRAFIYGEPGRGKTLTAAKAIIHLVKKYPHRHIKIGVLDTENASDMISKYLKGEGITGYTILRCKIDRTTHYDIITDTLNSFVNDIKNKCDLIIVDSLSFIGSLAVDRCQSNPAYNGWTVHRAIKDDVRKITEATTYYTGHLIILAREVSSSNNPNNPVPTDPKAEDTKSTEYEVDLSMRVFFETQKNKTRVYKADIKKNRYSFDTANPIIDNPASWLCNLIDTLESYNPVLPTVPNETVPKKSELI